MWGELWESVWGECRGCEESVGEDVESVLECGERCRGCGRSVKECIG